MESMMAYGGNNLMNLIMSKVYATQRNKFKGSGTAIGLTYSYDVAEAPVAELVPNSSSHNLEIDLKKVSLSVKGDTEIFNQSISMKAVGKLVISRGRISLSGLKISTSSNNLVDQLVVLVVNKQVIPKLKSTLEGTPIPQLTNVFDSGLSASLRTGKVVSGPALEAGARINGKGGIADADAPAPATISLLNKDTAGNARMIGLVSGEAVNVLIQAVVPPMSHTFNESASKGKFGAGIKGTIRATTPDLTVKNGSASANTTISFSGLKGGIKIPIKGWTWVPLPAPKSNVVVTNRLSALGNTGFITLTGVNSIKVSFSWPRALKLVEVVLKRLLNGILVLFRGIIGNAVKGRKFEIFSLPSTIPGTSLGAQLSFDSGGLRYYKSSVQALIRIKSR